MIDMTAILEPAGIDLPVRREENEGAGAKAFAMELASRFKDANTRAEKIEASFQTLADMFPTATIRIDDGVNRSQTAPAGNEVAIGADILAHMARDVFMAEQVRQLLESFTAGGQDRTLVDSRQFEGQVWRSMSIQANMVGYYESYRTQDGKSAVAMVDFKLEFDYRVSQNFEKLLGGSASSRNAGKTNSGMFPFSGFWQFSGFFSLSAAQSFNIGSPTGNGRPPVDLSWDANPLGMIGIRSNAAITVQLEAQMQQVGFATGELAGLLAMFGLVDPLVLDLGGEGINLRAVEDGVFFDMHGDGNPVKTSFIQGNNAFLYIDWNGGDAVDSIHHLFGDSQGHANGFAKLAEYDTNGDGVIDEKDDVFSKLRLWRDLNGDGALQEGESMTLAEAGIVSINLGYDSGFREDGKGNVISETSTFTRADGSSGVIADVWLKTLANS